MTENFSTIDSHIEKLIHLHQQTLIENKKLVELNQSLNSKIEDQKIKLHQLDEQIKTAKVAQGITGDGEIRNSDELKNNINKFIKEIDRCLILLNR